jgi:hypothetical protein
LGLVSCFAKVQRSVGVEHFGRHRGSAIGEPREQTAIKLASIEMIHTSMQRVMSEFEAS